MLKINYRIIILSQIKYRKDQQEMINSQLLLKKLKYGSSIQHIQESSRLAQLRLAKIIYNNRGIRQIAKFLRDADSVLRKSNQGYQQKRIKTQQVQTKKRYEENELKEMNFQFQSIKQKYIAEIYPEKKEEKNENTRGNSTKRKDLMMKKRMTQFDNPTRRRKQTIEKTKSGLEIQTRMRGISLSSNKSNLRQPLSPLKLKIKLNSNLKEIVETKISLKQEELLNALNNIINLVNTQQSKNYHIERQEIFDLISKRYQLKRAQNRSRNLEDILNINEESNDTHHIQIPFLEFVSLKDCRKSIDRIFNMSLKTAQRIAFKIYDRNNNGVIDQKDIIELFSIAENLQPMQEDMELIIKNYKFQPALIPSSRFSDKSNVDSVSFRKRGLSYIQQSDINLSKQDKFQVIPEDQKRQLESSKFRKSIFFTFKQTKQEFFKRKKNKDLFISLTWADFQLAFRNKRPKIFYDLLDYLFNINSFSVYQKASQGKKSNLNIFSGRNDGKSEAGSIFRNDYQQDSKGNGQKKYLSSGMKVSKKIKEKREQSQINKQKSIDRLIGKVKSIEYFDSLKNM